MQNTDQRIEKILRDIVEQEDVQNCEIVRNPIGNKGDGYLGTFHALQLCGSNKTVEIVMKLSRDGRGGFPTHDIYLNEITYYEKVLPAYTELNEEHQIIEPFDNVIQFYGAVKERHEECIVMKNIKVNNYVIWDRKQPLDNVHWALVLKTLAKLHATSFAFKTFKPETYRQFAQQLFPPTMLDSIFENMEMEKQLRFLANEVVELFDERSEYQYWKKMSDFAEIVGDTIQEMMLYRSDEGMIIQHGDFWCLNFMFQYDNVNDRSRPTNMKLFDFQLAKEGKPVMDLSTFFYSSATREVLDNELYYLKMYHDALTNHVQKFKLSIDMIYSFDDLMADWKTFSKFGFGVALMFKKVMLINSEDAQEFDNPEYANSLVLRDSNWDLYKKHIRDLFKFCVDRNYM